jgi:hypothetical protein
LVSKYWIPNWSGENPDSSARYLDIFNAEAEDEKLQANALQSKEERQKIEEKMLCEDKDQSQQISSD